MLENKDLIKSFYVTYSVGLITIFLVSSIFIYTPFILSLLQISKQQFSFAPTFFGIFVVISNLLSSRFLIPKIGTTNCLITSRLIISFIPFSVFYFENYFFLLLSFSFLGVGMGIQAPSALTQVTIIEKKTNQILMPIFKTSWAIGAMIAAIISSISLWLNIDALNHFFILGIIAILAIVFIKIYGLKKL